MGVTIAYGVGANLLSVSPGSPPNTDPHSIVGWCNPSSVANFNEQVEINTSSGGVSVLASTSATAEIAWRMSNSTFSAFTDLTANVNVNEWHHVCGTYDGTTMRLYVDGVAGPTATPGYGTRTGTWAQCQIGPTDGTVEFAHFFSAAITAQDVAALYGLKWPPRRTANLEMSYPLYNGTALRLVDFSGKGRNLTLTGAASDATIAAPAPWMIQQLQYARQASSFNIDGQGSTLTSGTAAMTASAPIPAAGLTLVSGAAAMSAAAQLPAAGVTLCNGVAIMTSDIPVPTLPGTPSTYFDPRRKNYRPWKPMGGR